MKKIILAPDSFKGTMSSVQICKVMASAILNQLHDVEIIKIPVADGGEGTVECFLEASGGKKVGVRVRGPYFEEMDSFFGVLGDGKNRSD